MNLEQTLNLLVSHRLLGGVPREELTWIAKHGVPRRFEQGESVCRHTEVVDSLHILFTGKMSIYMRRGTGYRKTMEWTGGEVWGMLPYSRMTTPPGDTYAEEPTEVLTISRSLLPDLIRNCYEVTAILVHIMTDRARRFTSTSLRDEKMRSLGKLAAGFAHEVNNPASAVLRDAKSLAGTLTIAEDAARTLFAGGLNETQLAELDALWNRCRSASGDQHVSGLALADREDAIATWLADHELPEQLAEDLARLPVGPADLGRLAGALEAPDLEAALRWTASSCAGRFLVANIERAATRIHTLVAAAKGFTHMDRSPEMEFVEIGPGIADTVALLQGKARGKSVTLSLEVADDLPPIRGFIAEINQVWMNLIDNAIDASPEKSRVTIGARLEGADVIVSVADEGPGIPDDIRESIFDPFFTTKPVGEGTGLGLDIVNRIVTWHNGDVTVNSRSGRTEFVVRLPVTGGL